MAGRILTLALLLVPCVGETPVCATVGEGYSDLVNGEQHTTTSDAKECQDQCKRTDICAFFTWYPNTQGCWLQSSSSIKNVTFEGVISGPVRCPGDVNVPAVDTVVTGVQSGKVGKVVDTLNSSTGASLAWWAWVLIGLGVAACGLCILSFICCSTKKKSKRSQKVSAQKDVEAAAPESAPLMTGGSAQVAAPATSIRSLGAAPVTAGAYAASPVQSYGPVYTSGGAYQYQPAAPVTYAQAAPVASAPQDLFTQLDVNGDGVLSPQELAALQAGMRPVPAVPAGFTQVPQ